MANVFYNNGKKALLTEEVDVQTYKVIFFSTSYTPDIDNEVYLSDVSASRASGSTDQTLANVTVIVNTTNDRAVFDADDVAITGQTFTSDKVGIYMSTGVDSTSPMILCIDIGSISPVGGPVTLPWNPDGIFFI